MYCNSQDKYYDSEKLLYKYCDFTLQYLNCNFISHFVIKMPYSKEYEKSRARKEKTRLTNSQFTTNNPSNTWNQITSSSEENKKRMK